MARFLFIEDNPSILASAQFLLEITFPDDVFFFASSYAAAVSAVKNNSPLDGCVTDFNYAGIADGDRANPKGSGALDFIDYLKVNNVKLPVVIFSGTDAQKITSALQCRGADVDAKF